MGTNIADTTVIKSTLAIDENNALPMLKLRLPASFRDQIEHLIYGDNGRARLADFRWCGEGSGYAANHGTLEKVIALTEGDADLLLTWEGGNGHTGLRVRGGTVKECGVVLALEPEEPAK